MAALQKLLIEEINACEGVRQTRTVIALSTLKEESYVQTAARGANP
jgi:DNA-binding Lrp family transcriptional regulator